MQRTRFRTPSVVAAVFVASVVGAPGCARSSAGASDGGDVVASFYPLAEAAQRVGGAAIAVTDLTPPGVEPHDLELTPDQIEAIDTANVVLYVGGGFQPAVEDAIGDATGRVVDVSSSLRTLPVPDGASDASLTADPHVWLDPVLYAQIVEQVRAALAEVDPNDTSAFAASARSFDRQLRSLDADYRSGLSNCDRSVIVTSHAAFGYLAERYGLTQEAISGLSPDAEPTPDRLASLKSLVEREGVTTIFTEELLSPKVAETLAQETGATTAVLNPLESLTAQQVADGEGYVSVMRDNLATLRGALGCA